MIATSAPSLRKTFGDCGPDAAAAAGDEGYFAVESGSHSLFLGQLIFRLLKYLPTKPTNKGIDDMIHDHRRVRRNHEKQRRDNERPGDPPPPTFLLSDSTHNEAHAIARQRH